MATSPVTGFSRSKVRCASAAASAPSISIAMSMSRASPFSPARAPAPHPTRAPFRAGFNRAIAQPSSATMRRRRSRRTGFWSPTMASSSRLWATALTARCASAWRPFRRQPQRVAAPVGGDLLAGDQPFAHQVAQQRRERRLVAPAGAAERERRHPGVLRDERQEREPARPQLGDAGVPLEVAERRHMRHPQVKDEIVLEHPEPDLLTHRARLAPAPVFSLMASPG